MLGLRTQVMAESGVFPLDARLCAQSSKALRKTLFKTLQTSTPRSAHLAA